MDFSASAANWDEGFRIKRAKIIADEISKVISSGKHRNALEFGCGTGLISFNIYHQFSHVTLIDTAKGMIDALKQKIEEAKAENMTAICTDINGESLTEKFDVIYTSMVLHHIEDVEGTLQKLYKMLNNGGYLCIVDLVEEDGTFHKLEKDFVGHNGFNQSEFKKMMEHIGFKSVKSNVIYKDYKMIEDKKVGYSLFLMVGVK